MRSAVVLDGQARVFEDGTVFRIRSGAERPAKISMNCPYPMVGIGGRTYRVHRLIATAFIPNPDGKPQVNHKDGNKRNNSVENLEWVTVSENTARAWRNGLNHGSTYSLDKLDYPMKKAREKVGFTQREVAEKLQIDQSSVSLWETGKTAPRASVLVKLSKLYCCTVDDLLKQDSA